MMSISCYNIISVYLPDNGIISSYLGVSSININIFLCKQSPHQHMCIYYFTDINTFFLIRICIRIQIYISFSISIYIYPNFQLNQSHSFFLPFCLCVTERSMSASVGLRILIASALFSRKQRACGVPSITPLGLPFRYAVTLPNVSLLFWNIYLYIHVKILICIQVLRSFVYLSIQTCLMYGMCNSPYIYICYVNMCCCCC